MNSSFNGVITMVTRRLYSGSLCNVMRAILLLFVGVFIVDASKEVKTSETPRNLGKESGDSTRSFLPSSETLLKGTTQDSSVAVKNFDTRTDGRHLNDVSVEQQPYAAAVFTDETDGLDETAAAANDTVSWPFHNKTKDACASHMSCFECTTSSSLCHWCAHDNACHAKGSIHGCLEGLDCTNHTEPNPPKDKNETKCANHQTCSECTLSSSFCHWCSHDNACHAVGSYYGCVTGVNCYSNDRCRRKEPAPIEGIVFEEMGFMPIFVILVLGGICFCCSTLGYCVAGGVKGAYDDLADIASQAAPAATLHTVPGVTVVPQTHAPLGNAEASGEGHGPEGTTGDEEEACENANDETEALVNQNGVAHYRLMTQDEAPPPMNTGRRATRNMDRLFTACSICYVISLITIGGFVLGTIRYFPKVPQYNICNDSLAWKSLVDSMTSMKVDADIEILMSIANPNHFDVALDMGRGTFSHNGAFVGTFEIPPATAKAMSITDMMILAKFTPEKWEALSLTAEYYRGTLSLDVDSQASIRVPALANYSYQAKVTNMRVHVNDPTMMDRHLCACPQWKDAKNSTPSLFPFE